MKTKQKIKIKITDDVHLKAVCEVLESMGYKKNHTARGASVVLAGANGGYGLHVENTADKQSHTLTDLLKMRDEMIKEGLKNE